MPLKAIVLFYYPVKFRICLYQTLLKPACSILCFFLWFDATVTVGFVHRSHSGSADVANWELSCFSHAAVKRCPACRAVDADVSRKKFRNPLTEGDVKKRIG